jgi:hypothetical protein
MGLIQDLKSLEELHARGRLSDQEFAAAKAAAISKSGPAAAPAAAPAPAIASELVEKKPTRKGVMLWRLIGVAVLLWLLWFYLGKPSTTTMKELANLPADIKSDSFGLSAASWRSTPITVPYSGSLTISVQVTRGNPVHIFLTNQEGVQNFKDTLRGTHFGGLLHKKRWPLNTRKE